MKTKKLIVLSIVAAAMGYSLIAAKTKSHEQVSNLMLANIEALARNEGSDCNYKNGYTAFTNRSGGAYDCCQVWVSKAPNTNEGHCR